MGTSQRSSAITMLIGAGLLGTIVGVGSIATTPEGQAKLSTAGLAAAVATGVARERAPQSGDYWGGCNAARAAGTAPIFRGEPGYRPEMDGDNDGIACEPYIG